MKATTKTPDSKRAQWIKANYRFEKTSTGYRFTVAGCDWSSNRVIEGADREAVEHKARCHWGHFNFEDEARAFREIFEAVRS
jgi:hypothetical protein